MQRLALAALLFAAVLQAQAAVVVVDSVSGRYLKDGPAADLGSDGTAAMMAGLTGLLPASPVSAAASAKAESVLQPVLSHPRAHIVLNCAGLGKDDVAALFGSRKQRLVHGFHHTASVVAELFTELASANSDAEIVSLEQVQNCKTNCMSEFLGRAVSHSSGQAMESQLTFQSGASLDLTHKAAKLYAVELSAVQAGLQAQLEALVERAKSQDASKDVLVAEATLLGLSGLGQVYGGSHEKVQAAKAATMALLKWAVQQLDAALDGDVTYQVSLFENVAESNESVDDLLAWKDKTRRALQETVVTTTASAVWPGADEAALAKAFTAKACGYGGFILLVYFSLAGIWCMCNMPMQADTLLFGAGKKDN